MTIVIDSAVEQRKKGLAGKATRLQDAGYGGCVASNGTPCSNAGQFNGSTLLCGPSLAERKPISKHEARTCLDSPRHKH